jgi:HK97 family phage portal protein
MAKAIFLGNEVKNLSLTDPQAWADVLGWEVNKGDLTAPLAASAVGWVYRCIHIRAGAVASLPWAIYRGDEKIIDQDETSLALPWADDLGTMLYLTESALCIYGYAYWRKVINRGRSISELRWWSPETTTPVWDAALGLVAFDRRVNNRLARYPKDEIVYFRIPSAAHETEPGTSPVAAALDDAGILYNVNQFASSFFKRGAIKATLLTVEGDPLQSERERLKSWWRRAFEGIGNAWSTEVISAAVKPVIIGEGIAELGNTELTQERREGISTAMGVPHSLVMSNAANFATAQSDTQGFYDWTIRPQARILANVLNRQLFAPLGLQFRFDIESLSIYQEDEEQRSGALLNLVNAGVPLPLAMEILGVDLPGTLTYEELQSQLAPVEVAPIPAPALPPPPPPVEDGKAIDLKRFRSWAAKRKQPDPDDFKSDHLSRWEKAAILAELREDADGGTMSPFLPTDGTHTHKAALPLDPDNPEAELVARMEVEAEAERGIATALAKQQRAVVAAVQQENTVQAAEVALRDTRGTATDALRRALIASADLGVSVAVSQFENIGFGFDWTLSNTAARAWAERHVGTLIRQIDETTLKQVRQSVAAWVDNGEPLSALRRELAVTFGPQRAQRIAATEVTRAYAEGNLQAYRDSGVVSQIELRTAVDERVCPVCGPLDGKKTDANNPSFGGQGIPPFHVNCRCWIVPVVGEVAAQQTAQAGDGGRGADAAREREYQSGLDRLFEPDSAAGDLTPTYTYTPFSETEFAGEKPVTTRTEAEAQGWQSVMSSAQADIWAKNSVVQNPMLHMTSESAATSIRQNGFSLDRTAWGRVYGDGVYMSDKTDVVSIYRMEGGGETLKLKINVTNPYHFETDEVPYSGMRKLASELGSSPAELDRLSKILGTVDADERVTRNYAAAITKIAQDAGYDSLHIVPQSDRLLHSIGGDQWVIFDTKKVTVIWDG